MMNKITKFKNNLNNDYEERKTTVTNTSKNIYKPSFNLPQKDNYLEPTKESKKKQQDVKRNFGSAAVKAERKRSASKGATKQPLKRESSQMKIANETTTSQSSKIFTKPKMSSKKNADDFISS